MYEQLLLLAAAAVGATAVGVLRRLEAASRPYLAVLAALGAASLGAIGSGSRFLGVAAIGFTSLVVVVPWLLEAAARVLFGRGKLRPAVWCAGLRAMLMLGAGLGRPQEILQGLAVLERDGVDAALDHFRKLGGDTEDDGELVLINEQIVSMLFYGQRWAEGIAHYEARFHPRYAALRPALALGLLRAYGESGRLDSAAVLLRAVESGPVGSDPRALGLVSQARLTFLAYAGAAPAVTQAVSEGGLAALGLSEASGALFAGIAHLQSGDRELAESELRRVSEVARGDDDRVVVASQRAIDRLAQPSDDPGPSGASVPEELSGYVESVSAKLGVFVEQAPAWRHPTSLFAVGGLAVALLAGYLATAALGRGALGWVDLGAATPALIQAEGWTRIASGVLMQGDPLATLLVLYTFWVAGPVVERNYGPARLTLLALLGGVTGLCAAAYVGATGAGAVLGGANFVAIAIAAAALWTVSTQLVLTSKARMRRLLPLALLMSAHGTSVVPGLLAVDVPWSGFAVAVMVGMFGAFLPASLGRRAHAVLAVCLIAALGFGVAATIRRPSADRWSALRDRALQVGAARVFAPATFVSHEERREVRGLELPLEPGAMDTLAMRGGWLVQFAFGAADSETEGPVLLRIDDGLGRELRASKTDAPEGFEAAYRLAGGAPEELRAFRFRRNGEPVGVAIERPVAGGVLVLIASPAQALEPGMHLYAAMLADAGPR